MMNYAVIVFAFSTFSGVTALILHPSENKLISKNAQEQAMTQYEQEGMWPWSRKKVDPAPVVNTHTGSVTTACPGKGLHKCMVGGEMTCLSSCGSHHHDKHDRVVPFAAHGQGFSASPIPSNPMITPVFGAKTRSFGIVMGGHAGDTWETAVNKISVAFSPDWRAEWKRYAAQWLQLLADKVQYYDDSIQGYPPDSTWDKDKDKYCTGRLSSQAMAACRYTKFTKTDMGVLPEAMKISAFYDVTLPLSFVEYTFKLEEYYRISDPEHFVEYRLLWSGQQGKDLATGMRDAKNYRCSRDSSENGCKEVLSEEAAAAASPIAAEQQKTGVHNTWTARVKYVILDDKAIGALFSFSEAIACPQGSCTLGYLKTQRTLVDPFESYSLDNICNWKGYPCVIPGHGNGYNKQTYTFQSRCDVFYDEGTLKDAGSTNYFALPERKCGIPGWGLASELYMTGFKESVFRTQQPGLSVFRWVVDVRQGSRRDWYKMSWSEKKKWLAKKAAMKNEIKTYADFFQPGLEQLEIEVYSFPKSWYPPSPSQTWSNPSTELRLLIEDILTDNSYERNPLPNTFKQCDACKGATLAITASDAPMWDNLNDQYDYYDDHCKGKYYGYQ